MAGFWIVSLEYMNIWHDEQHRVCDESQPAATAYYIANALARLLRHIALLPFAAPWPLAPTKLPRQSRRQMRRTSASGTRTNTSPLAKSVVCCGNLTSGSSSQRHSAGL
uniref:Uncharacterized protein n=1 Tax=Mycena chlorophos TaxID=658473 RepID=A0ABQ0LEC7_MYCCL|nr:predicted protein [Mycena chlorophos]